MSSVDPNQVMIQQATRAMVEVAAYSAFATALGTAITSMGVVKAGTAAPDNVIRELDRTFGKRLVDVAIKNVGKDDTIALCHEIDRLYTEDLRSRYGSYVADAALAAAPPLETRVVEDIARAMSGRAITPYTPEPVTEEVVISSRSKAMRKHPPIPYLDMKTNKAYPSRASLWGDVYTEFGRSSLVSLEAFMVDKQPKRFKKITQAQFEAHTGPKHVGKRQNR